MSDRVRVRMRLPEPPTLNQMLDLAKKRERGYGPARVYNHRRKEYALLCKATLDEQGLRPPKPEWEKWEVVAVEFRVHTPKDPIELLASLKWAIDVLVHWAWVKDDSPRELVWVPPYDGMFDREQSDIRWRYGHEGIWQVVDRQDRGVTLEIEHVID